MFPRICAEAHLHLVSAAFKQYWSFCRCYRNMAQLQLKSGSVVESDYVEFKLSSQNERDKWFYFKRHKSGQSAMCKTCKNPFAIIPTPAYGTSGLYNHLFRVHKIDLKKISLKISENQNDENVSNSNPVTSQQPNNTEKSQASSSSTNIYARKRRTRRAPQRNIDEVFKPQDEFTLDSVITEFVAKEGLPFIKVAKSNVIRKLMVKAGLGSPPNSDQSIKNIVFSYYGRIKEQEISALQSRLKMGEKFSITLDEWKSIKGDRYINVNLHDKKSWFLSLGLIPVTGKLDAVACALLVEERLSEFGINLEKDIVCATNDGCSMMLKFGSLIACHQQLCYAHAIQLAVIDVLYSSNRSANDIQEDELVSTVEQTESDAQDDNQWEDVGEDYEDHMDLLGLNKFEFEVSDTEIEISNLNVQDIVKKIRKASTMFRKSTLKSEILQKYVKSLFSSLDSASPRKMSKPVVGLILDNRIRWSSLYKMCARYLEIQNAVNSSVAELKRKKILGKNVPESALLLDGRESKILKSVVKSLEPVKNAVEQLCTRDATLLSADKIFEVLFKLLKKNNSEFGCQLYCALVKRISKRRTCLSELLYFLHSGYQGTNDSSNSDIEMNEIDPEVLNATKDFRFDNLSLREKKLTLTRLLLRLLKDRLDEYPNSDEDIAAERYHQPEMETRNLTESDSDSEAIHNSKKLFVQAVSSISSATSSLRPAQSLRSQISKEFEIFVSSGTNRTMEPHIRMAYEYLLTIKPTSVEPERAFSGAGNICTKIRSSLEPLTLDRLCFLNTYFK